MNPTDKPPAFAARVARERGSLDIHRAALRGGGLPPVEGQTRGTFLHGFLLTFSLMAVTLRDRNLRRPYLRLIAIRGLIVSAVGVFAIVEGEPPWAEVDTPEVHLSTRDDPDGDRSDRVVIDFPGLHLAIDRQGDGGTVSILGHEVPVPPPHKAEPLPDTLRFGDRLARRAKSSWRWLLALVGALSAAEWAVVMMSRRWDDQLSSQISRLARVRPEDETPPKPAIALDLKWGYRKLRRRLRGHILMLSGLPLLLLLRLIPTAGTALFAITTTAWAWYWFGIFSAAKSAHAWADEAKAPAPSYVRALGRHLRPGVLFAPLRAYVRVASRLTQSVRPAVATFERTPAPFLGLALARTVLSLPGLYLFARPLVPVASGRLCAEGDPENRFTLPDSLHK